MEYCVDNCRELLQQFGSPMYLFDEAAFEENYRELEQTFRNYYPRYQIAYSYKTNYTPYICRTVKKLGGFAEVVSGMEYRLAKRLGYEDEKILFNGPDKGADGLEAFRSGAMVNADSLTELQTYCQAALAEPEKQFSVGIRVNLDLGQNFISRFGIGEDQLPEAFAMAAKAANLHLNGLHCHISRCRGLQAWSDRAEFMLALADRYFDQPPKYIDLGSGMFGSMAPDFACQFSDVPSYQDYAQAVAGQFAAHYGHLPSEQQPVLITEPGTTLVNRYVDVLATVTGIKKIRGKTIAVLDCSEHILGETSTLKRLPIQVFHAGENQEICQDAVFSGYTCLEQDVFYQGYTGQLGVGDYVVFGNAGGYSNVLKPPFIRPNCAMAAACPDGKAVLIKRRETFEDIFGTYSFV